MAVSIRVLASDDDKGLPIVPIRIAYKDLVDWVIVDYSRDCSMAELPSYID